MQGGAWLQADARRPRRDPQGPAYGLARRARAPAGPAAAGPTPAGPADRSGVVISVIQMYHLNGNITWAVALEVTNINFLIAHFAMIYENIISLHVSLIFGTV